jgi:hypothetical protein
MAKTARPAFDPSDAFDAMAESVRRQVCDVAIGMFNVAIFRDLPPDRRVECLMAGLATGMIGVLFAQVDPEHRNAGRDALMEVLVDYLPQARQNAEDVLDNG